MSDTQYVQPPATGSVETRTRTLSLKELIEFGHVVKITAADFNGKEFDGSPIEPVGALITPTWFVDAMEKLEIMANNVGGTDYASFWVYGDCGTPVWAGPGDYIIQVPNGTANKYIIVHRSLLQLLGYEKLEDMLYARHFDQYMASFRADAKALSDSL